MATFEIKMPKLGESITEGTIIIWSVKEGDIIKEDDVLFEVSTQKVSAEIPSPVDGKIIKILVKEGETVAVGTTVALVETEGENNIEEDSAPAPISVEIPEEEIKEEQIPGRWYSPVVLSIAKNSNISQDELDTIPGTGYVDRLTKKDLQLYIEHKGQKQAPVSAIPSEPRKTAPLETQSKSVEIPPQATTVVTDKGDEIIDMDPVRRIIADHMVMSKNVSPHVTTIIEADVTNLVRWRDKVKDEFFKREGVKLTFMPAIVEATAKALADFPRVNASVDGYKMIFKKHINIGVAVALDDGNLIVPVIKNADQLNLNGLAIAIDSTAQKARKSKLSPDDIQGGTFTVTNFGTFKNIIGTPIINQPQVAILGVGYVQKKPAVVETPEGDMIAIRHKMYLSLSYDHRIIDGALGGAFVHRIAGYLENWKL